MPAGELVCACVGGSECVEGHKMWWDNTISKAKVPIPGSSEMSRDTGQGTLLQCCFVKDGEVGNWTLLDYLVGQVQQQGHDRKEEARGPEPGEDKIVETDKP